MLKVGVVVSPGGLGWVPILVDGVQRSVWVDAGCLRPLTAGRRVVVGESTMGLVVLLDFA